VRPRLLIVYEPTLVYYRDSNGVTKRMMEGPQTRIAVERERWEAAHVVILPGDLAHEDGGWDPALWEKYEPAPMPVFSHGALERPKISGVESDPENSLTCRAVLRAMIRAIDAGAFDSLPALADHGQKALDR
jgi:hypothetical protein